MKLQGVDPIWALEQRAKAVRKHVLTMISHAQVGHPGGSLSCVDLLVALYFAVLRIDPRQPSCLERDQLILSKGHAATALYATLAERGFFPLEWLATFGKINSALQVHPDRNKVPGVDASTGALGQGLSIGLGVSLAASLDQRDSRIFVLLGDGELQEGQIWEAAMACSHYKVDNLVAIVDLNQVQLTGPVSTVMGIQPLPSKFKSFGWNVLEIDGHQFPQILEATGAAKSCRGKPTVIIARTVKGKGCSFMENKSEWHGRAPTSDELCQALAELDRD
ncbi:MAG: transketolase [Coprothermobacterota bacterium]|nr:transketolase [Coprothermobacterota bacterium]